MAVIKKDRISFLEKKLVSAADSYYNSDSPELTDAEFDKLRYELTDLDPENTVLKQIGAPPKAGHLEKVKHKIPMGSLSNCTKEGDSANPSFPEWHAKRGKEEVVVMHKLDGSSLELIYEKGKLVQAITRGDGVEGEDITQNARKFKNVPNKLGISWSGSVRGEALLMLKDFNKYFEGQANPRNAANGTVRRSDGTGAEHISFIAFDMIDDNPAVSHFTHDNRLSSLDATGFTTVVRQVYSSTDEVMQAHEKEASARPDMPYEIDGLVIRVNEEKKFQAMGEKDSRPKGAVAFKFKAMQTTTKLLGIKLSIGHTGAIVPTADLSPVELGGVTVTSALLNNFGHIEKLGIAVNDQITVIRAGDVIPKVAGVSQEAKDRKKIVPPESCIICKTTLDKVPIKSQKKNEVPGYHLICPNEECEGRSFRLLKSWVTKRNILHIGDTLLQKLYDEYNVREPADIYLLKEEELAQVPRGAGVVGGNASRIMEQIEKSKECPLDEFVGSLGIKFLGRREAEIMIDQGVDTLKKFLLLPPQKLAELQGFGPTKAETIVRGLKKSAKRMKNLLDNGVKVINPPKKEKKEETTEPNPNEPLAGYAVCFTGVRPSLEENNKFVDLGGMVKSGVSKNTTHLVVRYENTTSSKARKARELGVKIVSYEEFQGWLS